MDEFEVAGRLVARDERRCKDGREFAYTAFFPDRRIRPDRRYGVPHYLVELEEEEISSLLAPPNDV
jgi:hypothetical protein